MVFEVLSDTGLEQYYAIEKTPGVKQPGEQNTAYAYLDEAETLKKLLDFSDGTTARIRFLLPQIHCASCIWLLENLPRLHPAVRQSTVNFLQKEVHIVFSEQDVSLKELAELLHKIGYPPKISLQDAEGEKKDTVDRSLMYKLGTAGFVFGNVMLLSFPEYLGLSSTETEFQLLFGLVNLMLGLPLVLYSGVDYLRSAWLGLKQGELNIDLPISIGILALFGRSTYEILTQTGAGYFDSLAGLLFFLLIGKWFQQKTYYTLSFERNYKSYFPLGAKVLEKGVELSRPLHLLKKEDVLLVRNGELIPADGILLRGNALIDYSFVTGEAEAVTQKTGDHVFAGGRQRGGQIQLMLTKTVSQSYLVQLWNERAFKNLNQKNTASQLAKKVGKYFTIAILLVSFTTLLYWLPKDVGTAINAFSAVLIIACPCAVALSIPFTFGNALRLLARNHFYLKHTAVIEALQQVTFIMFDKTGTLTYGDKDQLNWEGQELSTEQRELIVALANESAHPRSRQIVQKWKQGEAKKSIANFTEVTGKGITASVDGMQVKIGNAAFTDQESEEKQSMFFQDEADDFSRSGTYVQIEGVTLGRFLHESRLIPGLQQLVHQLKSNYKIGLLSGDDEREAERFRKLLGENVSMSFRQSPKDKLEYIRRLQEQGEIVMMIGDGLNDAGALQQADAGVVVSEHTGSFIPACDAFLRMDQMSRLPSFLNYARSSLYVVFAAYVLALIYNVVGLSYAVQAELSPVIAAILMPASSITIVVFGVLGSWWYWQRKIRIGDESHSSSR